MIAAPFFFGDAVALHAPNSRFRQGDCVEILRFQSLFGFD
jgi:hypothetical protein